MNGSGRLLAGQKALVTGASSGIGRAIAVALGQAGADVVVNWRSQEQEAEEVVEEIRGAGVRSFAHKADVSDESGVRDMFARAVREWGTLDIVVNNAGVQADAAFVDLELDDWQQVIDVNLTGSFLCAREAARIFLQRGVVEAVSRAAGKILFISSVHARVPWAGHVNYAASKGGMELMMRSVAQELARHRIRVNSLAPGAIRTPINLDERETEEARRAMLERIPYGRIGDPEDVARAAAWLLSDEADYITGASLVIDGGMQLYPAFASGQG